MTWSSRSEGLTSSIEALLASLLSTRFPSAAHFRKDWLLDWSLAAKWAWLLITRLIAAYPTHWRSKHNEGWTGLKTLSIELIMTLSKERIFNTSTPIPFSKCSDSLTFDRQRWVRGKEIRPWARTTLSRRCWPPRPETSWENYSWQKNIVITLAFLSHISLGL